MLNLKLLGIVIILMVSGSALKAKDNILELIPDRIRTINTCVENLNNKDIKESATVVSKYWGLDSTLLTRIIEKGEKNHKWRLHILSGAGAVGLAQIMPTTVCRLMNKYGQQCRYTKVELDRIAKRLRNDWRFNECWAGDILMEISRECKEQSLCISMIYNAGDRGLSYAKRVEK